MLVCDGQGRIKFSDVLDAVNLNESNIALIVPVVNDHDTKIIALRTEVDDHESRITTLETSGGTIPALELRVTNTENDIVALDQRVGVNETDIGLIQTDMASISTAITTNTDDISAIDARLSMAENDLGSTLVGSDSLTEVNDTNKLITQDDFTDLLTINATTTVTDTNKVVTEDFLNDALVGNNFSIIEHREATGINGGTATLGSWETRILNNSPEDNLLALVAGNKINLVAGKYQVEGYVLAEGTYHQARIYDETSALVAVDGTSGTGPSYFNSLFALAADSTLRIESQVDTTVADSGYGKQNPFGEGVFIQLKVTKIGD